KDLDDTVKSTVDIIRPSNYGRFTVQEMNYLKEKFWVLSTFEYEGATWVKILSGKWQPYNQLERFWTQGVLHHDSLISVQRCQWSFIPMINVLVNYSKQNQQKWPSPSLDNYSYFETTGAYGERILKANWKGNDPWGRPDWSPNDYYTKFRDMIDQQVERICGNEVKKLHSQF
ncbi:hypothetical protein FRC03_004024, partial [Tulasnella sp. 419]